ncbi:MAG: TetR/AcrR family transcriptional regulator [Myxococcales bacterium]|nr:TetR/AcrR family transcriptional regulator [Myxococcales bacterium]MCB9712535.1 TetR/AcrR family transcriptional regulator [Myxococcales bacterium]
MTRGYHHGDLRNALLDAAEAIVAEEGIAAVTMSKVAKRSQVSSGAPYRHFHDRMDLLRGLARRAHAALAERATAAAAAAPTPLEGFRRTGIEYVKFAVEQPALFTVLSRGELVDHDDAGTEQDRAFVDGLRELLSRDPSEPLDPEHPLVQQLAARCLVHGLAHMFVEGALAVVGAGPEQAERIADALTRALGPPQV